MRSLCHAASHRCFPRPMCGNRLRRTGFSQPGRQTGVALRRARRMQLGPVQRAPCSRSPAAPRTRTLPRWQTCRTKRSARLSTRSSSRNLLKASNPVRVRSIERVAEAISPLDPSELGELAGVIAVLALKDEKPLACASGQDMSQSLLPDDIISLARRVIEENRAIGRKIALAESCTGGLVAAALTEIPGSSAVLDRGFVTYSNEAKRDRWGFQRHDRCFRRGIDRLRLGDGAGRPGP